MEKSDAISDYRYEDEFSFITESGEIYRKQNQHQSTKKLGELSGEDPEKRMIDYRSNFVNLADEIEQLDEPLSEEQVQQWKEKMQNAQAIGDFNRLYKQLNDMEAADGQANAQDQAVAGEMQGSEKAKQDDQEDIPEKQDPVSYYKSLKKEAQDIAKSEDWNKASEKLHELSHQWSDGPEVQDEEDQEKIKDLYYYFTKAEQDFESRKQEHYKEAEKKRAENLSKKQSVVESIQQIISGEQWTATGKIKQLQKKWRQIGSIPKEKAADLKKRYTSLIKEFKSHKVDRLVVKRQKREDNLMMKMVVLDKMEQAVDQIDDSTINWDKVEATFNDFTKQWKKIGRVPREKSNDVWDRYKAGQDAYYDKKYKYNKDHRSNVDSFSAKKQNIIDDAKALLEQEDIAKAARKVNKLHRRWKKIGNLPQRKEDALWDRFKAATNAFNKRKANNADKIQEQEQEHYEQKLQLISQAEELKGTNNWTEGHKKMQGLMKQWKKIGPVSRKKSNAIWKQFKGAMDIFYDRRREHFKEAKEEQKENLKKKENILEKLRALGRAEDPIAAVNDAKKLQAQFKDVGYVPIKKKNEMWKKYREVCDVIYDRMRAAKSGNKFDQELAKAELDPEQRSRIRKLRKQHKQVKKEVRGFKQEVLQLQESLTNFNFSGDDNPLLKEMNDKISQAEAKLESKQNKLDAISMEMEDIQEEA